jgi:ABC-2 type transport system permease protein
MNTTFVQDLGAVIRKEFKELFASGGGRSRYLSLIILGLFGIVLPLTTGAHNPAWVSSAIPAGLYGLMMPLLLIMSVGADSFAGERERHTLETLLASRLPDQAIFFGKLLAVTVFGWGQGLVAALVALLVINVAHPGVLALYPLPIALAIVIFGLLVALVGAAVAALVSLRASTVRQASQMLSIGVMVIIFGLTFGIQALPVAIRQQLSSGANSGAAGQALAAALAIIAVILILWAMALFRRARLIIGAS